MCKKLNVLIMCLLIIMLTGCGKNKEETNASNNKTNTANVTITLEEYNKIETGMSYSEVKEIVGGDCNKTAEQELAGIKQAIYTCSGKEAGANALLTFQNDKLFTKTQINLK